MTAAVRKTAKAFDTVRRLHAATGAIAPCSWEAYRVQLTGFYKVDGDILDAMARLGHFAVTPSGHVRFLAA